MLVLALAAAAVSCASAQRDTKPTPRFLAGGPQSGEPATVSPPVASATIPPPVASATTRAPSATATTPPAPSPPAVPRWVGFYIPDVPLQIAPLATLQSETGQFPAVSHYFLGVAAESFSTASAGNAAAMGATPMITLEFWDYRMATNAQPDFSLKRIAAGAHDAYLRKFARDAAEFGNPVWLRPLHEMNGSWYPWCGTVNGNSSADFAAAWRHIYRVFHEEGATNVRFVWCPEATSVPDTSDNAIARYWPGDSYVDYVALDGYNAGTRGAWRSFGKIFSRGYADVIRLTDKPLFIAEVGCADTGGDKAAWIADMFRDFSSAYPRIRGVVWFDALKEHDWRIESSASSLAAFRQGARQWIATPD